MHLDEFLNGRSIANLQVLQWVWAPATPRSSSKRELLRLLRQQMLSPERARECFLALDEAHQEFLRGLLRLEGYEGAVDLLARRLPTPPTSAQAERELLRELSRRGFIAHAAAGRWDQADSPRALVPQELGDVLAEALNLDTREPARMLGLRHYLEQLGPEERGRLAGSRDEPAALLPQLTRPEAIEERIAALPDPELQRAVRLALARHAGVLPLERFPSHGLDIESVDRSAWRAALEAGLLGTFGHLCLLEHGLGDDHECLVLYQEVVHAHALAQATPGAAIDHVYACGIDFLTDLTATVDFVRATPAKLTSAGRFFKGARNQLKPLTALHTTFFMDEDSLLTWKLTVARELGLVELRGDGRLSATHASLDWAALPLADQARSVLDVMLGLGETAAPDHFAPLAEAALGILRRLPTEAWLPADAFLAALLSDQLLRRLAEGGLPPEADASDAAPAWAYRRRAATLGAIADAVREPLLEALNCAGLIDIGRCDDRVFVRTTPLIPVVLGHQPPAVPGQILIVNPDFEVALFPEEGYLELLHQLCAFCDREKSEVTLHLRITQESVQQAVLRGLDADHIIATLRDHCRVSLSQNIEYSIRTWAAGVYPAEVRTLHVLELPSGELLDAAIHLPEIAPLVLRRLSPTAVALAVPQLEPEAEAALKQLGIHLM
jgi:hypothetical protein